MRVTQATARGYAATLSKEGIVLMPYLDSVGVWTIFGGHTANAGAPNPLSYPKGVAQPLAEALRVFINDAKKFERRVAKAMNTTSHTKFDAGFSFDYNTGAIDRATWVKTHNAGNVLRAADEMLNWGKPPEILKRRKAEQTLYRDRVYPEAIAAIIPADSKGRLLWNQAKQINILPVAEQLHSATQESKKEDKAKVGTTVSGGSSTATIGAEVTEMQNQIPPEVLDTMPTIVTDWAPTVLTVGISVSLIALALFILWWGVKRYNVKRFIDSAIGNLLKNQEPANATLVTDRIHRSSIAISPEEDQ